MIILDTNIVSEFMTSPPNGLVLKWLNNQDVSRLHLTTITIAEINYGLSIMPEGNRKELLEERFNIFIESAFEQRILSFNESAARFYGELLANRRHLGRPMSSFDGQIASIARAHNFTVATRNIKDFVDCGLELINPFDYAGSDTE